MEKIIKFLNAKKIDADDVNPRLAYAISFYDEFFKRYPADDLYSYKDLDYRYYIVLFLARENPERLFDIEKIIFCLDEFFNNWKYSHYCSFFVILMHPVFRDINKVRGTLSMLKKVPEIRYLIEEEHLDTNSTIDVLSKIFFKRDLLDSIIALLESLGFTLQDAQLLKYNITYFEALKDFLNSNKDCKMLRKFLEKNKINNDIKKIIQMCYADGLRAHKLFLQQSAEITRQNNIINRIINFIEQNPDYLPFEVIKKVMRFPISFMIKEEFLNYAGNLNARKNEEMLNAYEASQNTTEKVVMRVLARFNIDINSMEDLQKEQILAMDASDLETILSFLATYHIAYDSVPSLICFDANKIKAVDNLLTKGTITDSFLHRHISIILNDNPDFDLMEYNISLLYQRGINIINYRGNIEILLQDIKSNLDSLSFYGLQVDKKVRSISFLGASNLLSKLDLAIEMDLLDEEGLDILNYSLQRIYQMGLCKKMDINYDSSLFKSFALDDLVPNPSLGIDSNMLKLFQGPKSMGILPEYLKPYVVSERKLVIEGIIISLPRFLRNLSAIDSSSPEEVYMAAIYGSYYTIDEAQIIQRVIAPSIDDALKRHKKSEE